MSLSPLQNLVETPLGLKGVWGGEGEEATRLGPLLNAIQAKGAQRDSEQDAELLIVSSVAVAVAVGVDCKSKSFCCRHTQTWNMTGAEQRARERRRPCKALSSEENASDKNGTKRCECVYVCVCGQRGAEKQWRQ